MSTYKGSPVVIDNGTSTIKAGFAGDNFPPLVFPSIVGKSGLVGSQAFKRRFQFNLTHPIKNGIISDWNSMEKIWDHVFTELNANSKDHPVFLTESPLNPKENRGRMTQIMFETFNTQAMYIAMQPVMSLFASGRTTGLVVDSGHGTTHTVPVYDGYAIPSAICRLELSGGGLTEYLQRLLMEGGYYLTSSGERQAVQNLKEKLCYVARNFANEMKATAITPPLFYELPDGQVITIGNERFRCSEALFNPTLVIPANTGIPKMVTDSILKCDGSIREDLRQNIVLSGGTTCLPGFTDRLGLELKTIAPKGQKTEITKSRLHSSWMGARMLASSSSFDHSWILKEEYDDFGTSVVHRKCF